MKTKINALDIYLISSEYKESLKSQSLNLKDEIEEKISFLERVSGKEVCVKGYDEENVKISEYENSKNYLFPIGILENSQTEEKEPENIEFNETIIDRMTIYIQKNKLIILGIFIGVFVTIGIGKIDFNIKTNILENKPQEIIQTGSVFETLTQRDLILQQKENFELQKQKDTREEKRKAIKEFDEKINASIEVVKEIKKQREEIAKQKIELSQ